MGQTFKGATSFIGGDISGWDVSSVTSTLQMFKGATSFNSNLAAWSTVKLARMQDMFQSAHAFAGDGVASFNVGKVVVANKMNNVFNDAGGITSCNRKRIDEAWNASSILWFKAKPVGWTGSERCE